MSGHSKWKTIKRQKGVADQKRGQAFTRYSNAITLSVREGGGVTDPEQNFKLRIAVEKARSINMPKDNIDRAIEKGSGKANGVNDLQTVVYEGFGPGGVAVIVEATTDNKMRTTSEVKNVFDRNGGSIGIPGSVAYQFQQKGIITVKTQGKSMDDIFLISADAGATDLQQAEDDVIIYTEPNDVARVRKVLLEQGIPVVSFELTREPVTTIAIHEKVAATKILSFLEKIENLDDVQRVFANYDIPEAIMHEGV